jgi:hypothetical protein
MARRDNGIMRRCYLLAEGARAGQQAVVAHYDPVSFKSTVIGQCARWSLDCFADVNFRLRLGTPCDLVHAWLLVSGRLAAIFNEFARPDIQMLEVPVLDSSGRRVLRGYKLINILRSIEGAADVDFEKTSESHISGGFGRRITLQYTAIAASVAPYIPVFRPKEFMAAVFISEEFAQAIEDAKVTGCMLTKWRSR